MREAALCDLSTFTVEGERYDSICPRCNLPATWWKGQRSPIRPCDPEFAAKHLEARKNPPKQQPTERPARNPSRQAAKISNEEKAAAIARDVLKCVTENPGLTLDEIAKKIKKTCPGSKAKVEYHLECSAATGIMRKEGEPAMYYTA
jgi:hypothetical protein